MVGFLLLSGVSVMLMVVSWEWQGEMMRGGSVSVKVGGEVVC